MKTAITDPSRTYLIISGGDGYQTSFVPGDKLEDAYLAVYYGNAKLCPVEDRESYLKALHDADNWIDCYALGPVRFGEALEDGYVEIILVTDFVTPQKAMSALVRVAREALYAADDAEEVVGDNGKGHVVGSMAFDELCNALDALDELPDDQPNYVMSGPAAAEWALRGLLPSV